MKKKKSMHGSRKWEIPLENSNVLKVHSKITKKKRCPTLPRKTKSFSDPFLLKRTSWIRAWMNLSKLIIGHKIKLKCHNQMTVKIYVLKLTFCTHYQQGWWNKSLAGAWLMPSEVQSTSCCIWITCKVCASKCA